MLKDPSSTTVHQLIKEVADHLIRSKVYFGHGTDNAWDEAVALVFQVLRFPFNRFKKFLNYSINSDQREQVLKILKRRIEERKPLPYLVHEAYFAGLPFYVDERVLIPRSPIAELIEQSFEPWIDPKHVVSVLDLCTGCGCMAIACAKVFPNAQVDAVDISQDALAVADINVVKHHVEKQVHLIQSDLFQELHGKKYDIIVSNPPYVSLDEMKTLPKEYKHEPKKALIANDFGLEIVLRILRSAISYLNANGILVVEIGGGQKILEQRFPKTPFLWPDFERGGEGVFLLTKEQLKTIS